MEPVGPATIIPYTVVGMFRLFFTSALVGSIVHETNLYAHQVLGDEASAKWTDVTADDIWAFLGFALLMGINRLPQLHLYWNTNPAFHYLPIAERITRDRFMAIWRFLHFTSNSPSTPSTTVSASSSSAGASSSSSSDPTRTHDRLWKVRPVISAVVAACKSNYRPHREQAIDEAMVAFKGRSSMKQYLPMKPVKRGFKIWVRADSHNGYVCEFECYTGRKGDRTEVGLGGSVVTRLTRDLVGKSYHIFMDRFFSSVSLYRSLLLENIYCTGTLKSNRRDFPPDLKEVSKRGLAQRGDVMTRQDGNVGVCVWQDTRPVTFMSSGHNPGHTKSIPRKRIDGTVMHVNCPISIVDYNKYMGGVDRGDQYRKYYHVHVKSRKSYKYIFWFLFEVCVFNSYVLSHYSPCNLPISSYLSYRLQLANELIGNYNSRKRHVISKTVIHHHLVVNTPHYPCKAPSKGRCKLHPCKSQTTWYCRTCDKHFCHTGDHTTDCFLIHHAQNNLYLT